MVHRAVFEDDIQRAFSTHPVVALLGPRQAGKTTLAREITKTIPGFPSDTNYFDLEDPLHEARLANPRLALGALRGLVVIDEIQRVPELFRVLVDRDESPAKFLILGSASRELIRQSSETLAGRVQYVELTPFSSMEISPSSSDTLWLRGGFPRAFLADSDEQAFVWLTAFIRDYLERDIPNLGIQIPAAALRRFWMMLTHAHGQVLNMSELGRSFGVADTTIRRYLDVLAGTFMMRLVAPWHENVNKRQIKRPKVYFRDSGIFHGLSNITSRGALLTHPKLGASWEGFALEEIIRWRRAEEGEVFFWAVHSQAELDLLIVQGGQRYGYEIKYTDRPSITRSVRAAADLLGLSDITIVHPGRGNAPLDDGIRATGLATLVESAPDG